METSFSEIWIGILFFSFKKMHLKMSSAKNGGHFVQGRWVKMLSVCLTAISVPFFIQFRLSWRLLSTQASPLRSAAGTYGYGLSYSTFNKVSQANSKWNLIEYQWLDQEPQSKQWRHRRQELHEHLIINEWMWVSWHNIFNILNLIFENRSHSFGWIFIAIESLSINDEETISLVKICQKKQYKIRI